MKETTNEIPINEWLVCSNFETVCDSLVYKSCPFFFAYKDEKGEWWKEIDESCNEQMDEAPKYWYSIQHMRKYG